MCYTRIHPGILLKIKKKCVIQKDMYLIEHVEDENTLCYIKINCRLCKITNVWHKNKTSILVKKKQTCIIQKNTCVLLKTTQYFT